MDLTKQSPADRRLLCKQFFFIGCAGLPFLWLVSSIWFFKYAFRTRYESADEESEGRQLRHWVLLSMAGTVIGMSLLVAWNVYFQSVRTSVEWGDRWTFILPIGRP